ncbi:DUF397 domain-containing protein [Actinosynnema sp. ALI-1.44]|uniref:DUF397 domain-containing protein n=1 Tax=Actinosynnema sp. ALI-1.44 TaxID=1933779 RepID=UPI00097C99A9|nr:DUF397 domain-containing protein [Actinosynnema sp. ALI-1.44]ONI70712.1 DUF397 domain-containing protein [Actinosynnema sp. ALI-1.44]
MTLDLSDAVWRKSSHSGDNGGACVEVALLADSTAIRDSKDPTGPVLVLTPRQWVNLRHSVNPR